MGYMPEKIDGDWRFIQDDQQVNVINEVVCRVLDGEPLRQVAAELTDRAVLTARARVNQLKGREIRGYSRPIILPTSTAHCSPHLGHGRGVGRPVLHSRRVCGRELDVAISSSCYEMEFQSGRVLGRENISCTRRQ